VIVNGSVCARKLVSPIRPAKKIHPKIGPFMPSSFEAFRPTKLPSLAYLDGPAGAFSTVETVWDSRAQHVAPPAEDVCRLARYAVREVLTATRLEKTEVLVPTISGISVAMLGPGVRASPSLLEVLIDLGEGSRVGEGVERAAAPVRCLAPGQAWEGRKDEVSRTGNPSSWTQ
jgi:hypothetical protein